MSHDVPADALANAARRLVEVSSLEETLAEIVHHARLTVRGADHVGVTLIHPDGS